MSDKNLFQRINDVRRKIDYIKKDKSVSTGGSSYKAVTHDQVTGMVRDHMVAVGIVSYPVLVSSVMNPPTINVDGTQSKQMRYEATYDFHFVNEDDPKDELVIRIEAHAMDNSDKAPGKALSYAKKYAVLKLFEIETGEDDESRYQPEGVSDDRIDYLILKIKSAEGDEKKAAYKDAINECRSLNDADAAERIRKGVN